MSETIRVCLDVSPPPKTTTERLALINGYKWNSGDAIRIRFLDGNAAQHAKVKQYAQEWTQFANLKLFFDNSANADIRISFVTDGSWSTIGTDCRSVTGGRATMNYGWLDADVTDDEARRVVLHEFGHALGFIHEHQNPTGGIQWNKPAVYAYYGGPPNNWSTEKVDHNIFKAYEASLTSYSATDRESIMMYPIPKAFTTNNYEVGLNTALSAMDKEFVGKMYPF